MYCAYRDCSNVAMPFSKISFFTLPTDRRREIWIENSGNEALRNLSAKTKKVFCETHFEAKDMRKQFMRTTLRKDAVPKKYIQLQEANVLHDTTALTEILEDDAEEVINVNASNGTAQSDIESDHVEFVYVIDQEKSQTNEQITQLSYFDSIEIADVDDDDDVDVKNDTESNGLVVSRQEIDVPNKRRRTGSTNDSSGPVISKSSVPMHHQENEITDNASPEIVVIDHGASDGKSSAQEAIVLPRSNANLIDSHDEETLFALSLVGSLKRLPPQKFAAAKCHILTYLMNLEYGDATTAYSNS